MQVITGLVPGGMYKYRMRAVCSTDGSVLSPWTANSFFTAGGGVDSCVAPSDAVASDINATSVTISWTPLNGAYGYQFRYRVAGTTAWTPIASNNGTVGMVMLTGLQANTTYEFQVRTKCSIGPNVFSNFTPIGTFATPLMRLGENELTILSLYPNPASGEVTMTNGNVADAATLSVVNALGQTVLSQRIEPANGTVRFNVSQLPAGVYLVELRNGNARSTGRLIKE
jgi:hypothetical protein